MTQYITRANDMLDLICFRFYGESQDYTEAVREVNPQLAEYGPVLPSGVVIALPALSEIAVQQHIIRLWN